MPAPQKQSCSGQTCVGPLTPARGCLTPGPPGLPVAHSHTQTGMSQFNTAGCTLHTQTTHTNDLGNFDQVDILLEAHNSLNTCLEEPFISIPINKSGTSILGHTLDPLSSLAPPRRRRGLTGHPVPSGRPSHPGS